MKKFLLMLKRQERLLNEQDYAAYESQLLHRDSNKYEMRLLRQSGLKRLIFSLGDYIDVDDMVIFHLLVHVNLNGKWQSNLVFMTYREIAGNYLKEQGMLPLSVSPIHIQNIEGDMEIVRTNYFKCRFYVTVSVEQETAQFVLRLNRGFTIRSVKQNETTICYKQIDPSNNVIMIKPQKRIQSGASYTVKIEYEGKPVLSRLSVLDDQNALFCMEDELLPYTNLIPGDRKTYSVTVKADKSRQYFPADNMGDPLEAGVHQYHSAVKQQGFIWGYYSHLCKCYHNERMNINIYYGKEQQINCDWLNEKCLAILMICSNVLCELPYKTVNIVINPDFKNSLSQGNTICVNEVSEDLLAHELCHLWWGNLVSGEGPGWLWFHEGFTEYFSKLATGKINQTMEQGQLKSGLFLTKLLQTDFFTSVPDFDDFALQVVLWVSNQFGIKNFLKRCQKLIHQHYMSSVTFGVIDALFDNQFTKFMEMYHGKK